MWWFKSALPNNLQHHDSFFSCFSFWHLGGQSHATPCAIPVVAMARWLERPFRTIRGISRWFWSGIMGAFGAVDAVKGLFSSKTNPKHLCGRHTGAKVTGSTEERVLTLLPGVCTFNTANIPKSIFSGINIRLADAGVKKIGKCGLRASSRKVYPLTGEQTRSVLCGWGDKVCLMSLFIVVLNKFLHIFE
jgi:hypothetical protein